MLRILLPTLRAWFEKIFAATESLKRFPNMGRVVPEDFRGTRREVIVWPYRLIYEIDEPTKVVSVTRVIHGNRDLTTILHTDTD